MQRRDHWSADEKYRSLFLDNPIPMWIYDQATKAFLEVNEEAIRHYGYSREEFLSMTISDIRPEEDISKLLNLKRSENNDNPVYRRVWRHYKKNGELIYVHITSHPILYSGRQAKLILVNDTSDKVKAEEQKERERLNNEALINNTEDMIWSIDRDLKLLAANKSFLDIAKALFGADLRPGDSVILEEMPEKLQHQWRKIYFDALQGNSYHEEISTEEDGYREAHWLEVRFNPIYNIAAIEGVACYARNITERKQNEEALKQSNERYNLISKATSDMVWDLNLLTGESYRNPEGWKKIFGEEDAQDLNNLQDEWQSRIHPDDMANLIELISTLDSNPAAQFFEFECRVRRNNGSYAYTVDKGYVIRDEDGRPVRLIGATQDITQKKEAEEKLKTAEAQRQHDIAEAVIAAQERDRQETGRELHDNINQILATARLYLGLIETLDSENDSFKSKVDSLLGTAIEEIRNLSHALITPTLGKTKLSEALNLLLDMVSKTSNFELHRDFSLPNERKLSEDLKLSIYRIVQEQLNNVQKYAQAKKVHVKLVQEEKKLKLSIADDGVGFDPQKRKSGIGLLNIRTRASLVNGKVKIISSEGNGCEIRANFPI